MLINNINYQNFIQDNNFFNQSNQLKNLNSTKFIDHIINSLDEISEKQNNADINTEKFTLNQSNSSLDNTMIDLQKSSISIQMIIQIRNKVMTAYQEIMNQPV